MSPGVRSGGGPPSPHPWLGRPAEFAEAMDPWWAPQADARTARVLRVARARYPRVCRIHVELEEIRPPIWRRLAVAEGGTLHELHLALQAVMGWQLSHLYEFSCGDLCFMEPDPDEPEVGGDTHDSRIVLLGDLGLGVGSQLRYLYDFGDGWEHDIRVEEIRAWDPAQPVPACLDGRRACPPEDVGGVDGYARMLEALVDPRHEEHESYRAWLGSPYDSGRFDPHGADFLLRREQALWKRRRRG